MSDSSHRLTPLRLPLAAALCVTPWLQVQASSPSAEPAWHTCSSQQNDAQRLACFDALAAAAMQQAAAEPSRKSLQPSEALPPVKVEAANAEIANTETAQSNTHPNSSLGASQQVAANEMPERTVSSEGCRDTQFDTTSRMWELTRETDCGNFRFRGYRPISIGLSVGDRINRQPFSPSADNGLASYNAYQRHEARLQLSIRTKLASNLLTQGSGDKRDSLWFGYTLNANWQAFNSALSRPFRNTDHQPEFMYVYPLEWQGPGQTRVRYAGLGLNHQSNGQSNPLSRSWNRYYMMMGIDVGQNVRLQTRLWQRIQESAEKDDNPHISDYIGRGELSAAWDVNKANTLALTLRHSLRSSAKGSTRLEWYRTLGNDFAGGKSNLRLYTSVFHGYGDSLIDYNYRRTVLSIGFSLLDF